MVKIEVSLCRITGYISWSNHQSITSVICLIRLPPHPLLNAVSFYPHTSSVHYYIYLPPQLATAEAINHHNRLPPQSVYHHPLSTTILRRPALSVSQHYSSTTIIRLPPSFVYHHYLSSTILNLQPLSVYYHHSSTTILRLPPSSFCQHHPSTTTIRLPPSSVYQRHPSTNVIRLPPQVSTTVSVYQLIRLPLH